MSAVAAEQEIDAPAESVQGAIWSLLGEGQTIVKKLSAGPLNRDVSLKLSPPVKHSHAILVGVCWCVPGSGSFPEFQGFFQIAPLPDGQTVVALYGCYEPPFGYSGAVFDAVAGQHIANSTIIRLLNEVIQCTKKPR
jgi:hypothetical protein